MLNVKDLLADALPIITQFAPTIGGVIGGPAGLLAAYFVPLLANVFKVSPTDLVALSSAIKSDPDAPNKLSLLEDIHAPLLNALKNRMSNLASCEINLKLNWQSNQTN